jgi:TrmH family RNA methyltransferase
LRRQSGWRPVQSFAAWIRTRRSNRTVITSLKNARIKRVIALQDRRDRDQLGLTRVEGYDEIRLALESKTEPTEVYVCPELFRSAEESGLLRSLSDAGAETIEVSRPVFEKLAYRQNPDGWLAVFPSPHRDLASLHPRQPALLLVVESVEKPGNLGAILRSADAAGVDAVIVCDPTTDLYNPNVVRSSRGTIFAVPVVQAAGAEALNWLHAHGIAILAATPNARTLYTDADMRRSIAIAVGTEDEGLTTAWLTQADLAVRIPMNGRVNSLNVAAAATLLLYEAVRQRAR